MAELLVRVIDVTRDNASQVWPGLEAAIREASFISVDVELSGIGPQKSLFIPSIDER